MRLSTIWEMIRNKQLFILLKLSKLSTSYYKLDYIAALFENGFTEALTERPMSLEALASLNGVQLNEEALKAWLQVGEKLGEIKVLNGVYQLDGLSSTLSETKNDALFAIIQEITSLHHKLIVKTPERLAEGKLWTLNDQEGEVIARSSRILEPVQREVIDAYIPQDGEINLLEVGCGSGIYIRHAAVRNPSLKAVGVELQEDVAEMARNNIEEWGLQERVEIRSGDVRTLSVEQKFDIVTLYNNIYYFSIEEREALFRHLSEWLVPGGTFIMTSAFQGGQPMMELLNLWGASTENCGRLPYVEEMVEQLEKAGFIDIRYKNLMPGDSFYVFSGKRPL